MTDKALGKAAFSRINRLLPSPNESEPVLSTYPRPPRSAQRSGGGGGYVGNTLASNQKIDAEELTRLRLDAGLSVKQLLALVGRGPATWMRWRKSGAPAWVGVLLRMKAGYLDHLGWSGWRIHKGRLLYSGWPYVFLQNDLIAWWYDRQLLRYHQSRNDTHCD